VQDTIYNMKVHELIFQKKLNLFEKIYALLALFLASYQVSGIKIRAKYSGASTILKVRLRYRTAALTINSLSLAI